MHNQELKLKIFSYSLSPNNINVREPQISLTTIASFNIPSIISVLYERLGMK